MGLKKRSGVNAQFNMSSLTDIIFLLLIFFMLTSSLVQPNALNLSIPGSRNSKPKKQKVEVVDIVVKRGGDYYIRGKKYRLQNIDRLMKEISKKKSGTKRTVAIKPHPKVPHEYVAAIMDLAWQHQVNAVLETPK